MTGISRCCGKDRSKDKTIRNGKEPLLRLLEAELWPFRGQRLDGERLARGRRANMKARARRVEGSRTVNNDGHCTVRTDKNMHRKRHMLCSRKKFLAVGSATVQLESPP